MHTLHAGVPLSSLDIICSVLSKACVKWSFCKNPGHVEAGSCKASCILVPRRCVQVEARKEPRVLGQVMVEGPFGADRRAESA